MIETIRISAKGKQQLIRLKKKTGIGHWNTLCRWAFCLSLAETSIPPKEEIPSDSNVEMTWRTFTGQYEGAYEAILKQRLIDDKLPMTDAHFWFRIHLHRGISYLVKKVDGISDLFELDTGKTV